MTRFAIALAVGLLFLAAVRGDTTVPLGPIVYGETPAFWDAHTLIDAVVSADRFEDDGKSLFTVDHLTLTVRESVPARYAAGDRVLLAVKRDIGPVRDRPQGLKPHFRQGDRLLVLVEKGRACLRADLTYAMMPEGAELYPIAKDDDPAVVATKKLCRALSEKDVGARLRLIEGVLKDRPDDRTRGVLRRALGATLSQARREAEEAERLLKEAGKE